MIYRYKGKTVIADNIIEASKMLGITVGELKHRGKEVRFALKEEEEEIKDNYEKLKKNNSYSDKLEAMLKKDSGTDINIHQKIAVAQLKDNPCSICGQQFITRAMTFHHADSTTKKFEVRVGRIRMKHLQEEVAKCILLCLNCHGFVHYIEEISDKERRDKEMKAFYEVQTI